MPWLFNVIPTILAMFNNPSWNIAKGLSNFNVHLCSLMISSFPFMNLIYLSISSQGQKWCLHPSKLTNRTYKKKNSEPIHLHFWGGSTKMKTFQGCSPPKTNKKKTTNWRIWRTPGALQRQIPTSSSITNQHGLWDLLGIFLRQREGGGIHVKIRIIIYNDKYVYIYKYTCIMYLYKWL